MINILVLSWKDRSDKGHAEMPEWLLVLCSLIGLIVPASYLYVLKLAAPSYLDLADKVPPGEWGWQGLLLTFALGALGLLAWNAAAFALCCGSELRDRWSN